MITIASQCVVFLADKTIRGLFSAMRLALAVVSKESLVVSLGINPSTAWWPIFQFLGATWPPNIWRNLNLRVFGETVVLITWVGLPLMGLAFGAVLKSEPAYALSLSPS